MSQEQLNVICKIIRNGAPALADELIGSIITILNENADMKKQLSNKTVRVEDCEKESN